ncbi:MAG: EAL domain-containing protein [Acidimicrobiia bacterium]
MFHLVTIAEGVEQPEQLKRLQELGCHQIEGFCFSRPIPRNDVASRAVHGSGLLSLPGFA